MIGIFYPNCTLPGGPPSGFVSGPNVRSTMDIVLSCLGVILLSTWSVLCLNVQPPRNPPTRTKSKILGKLERMWRTIVTILPKLRWMGIMLMAPEIPVARASANRYAASRTNELLQALADKDGVPWSLTHTIVANMGGITILLPAPDDTLTLDSKQLLLARGQKVIKRLPEIRPEEIEDRNKKSGLVRGLAILQVTWLAIQLIQRGRENILSTPLEVATTAFAACAFALYLIEWYKPMDLAVPFSMNASCCVSEEALHVIAEAAPRPFFGTKREHNSIHITNGSMHKYGETFRPVYTIYGCVLVISAAVFGSIHLLGPVYLVLTRCFNSQFQHEIDSSK